MRWGYREDEIAFWVKPNHATVYGMKTGTQHTLGPMYQICEVLLRQGYRYSWEVGRLLGLSYSEMVVGVVHREVQAVGIDSLVLSYRQQREYSSCSNSVQSMQDSPQLNNVDGESEHVHRQRGCATCEVPLLVYHVPSSDSRGRRSRMCLAHGYRSLGESPGEGLGEVVDWNCDDGPEVVHNENAVGVPVEKGPPTAGQQENCVN